MYLAILVSGTLMLSMACVLLDQDAGEAERARQTEIRIARETAESNQTATGSWSDVNRLSTREVINERGWTDEMLDNCEVFEQDAVRRTCLLRQESRQRHERRLKEAGRTPTPTPEPRETPTPTTFSKEIIRRCLEPDGSFQPFTEALESQYRLKPALWREFRVGQHGDSAHGFGNRYEISAYFYAYDIAGDRRYLLGVATLNWDCELIQVKFIEDNTDMHFGAPWPPEVLEPK